MKKILTLVMFAAMMIGSAKIASAASLTVDKDPVKSTFPANGTTDNNITKSSSAAVVSSTAIKDWINSAGATYTYVDDNGNTETGKVTASMCYYGPSVTSECVASSTRTIRDSATVYVIYKNASHAYPTTISKITSITWPDTIGPSEYLAGVPWDTSSARIYFRCANGYSDYVNVNTGMLYLAETVQSYTKYYGIGEVIDAQPYSYAKDDWKNKAAFYRVVLRWNGYCSAHEFRDFVYTQKNPNDIIKSGAPYYEGSVAGYWPDGAKSPSFTYDKTLKDLKVWNIAKSAAEKYQDIYRSYYSDTAGKVVAPFRVSTNASKYYDITVLVPSAYTPEVQYRAHVQNIGWQGYQYSADTAGTEGRSLRMEALMINIVNHKANLGSMKYRSHVQYEGDQPEVTLGQISGTTGKSRRMEGVSISFTGQYAQIYDIVYRVHVQRKGWMAWCKNGEFAGTRGEALRMEAIQLKTVIK